MPEVVAFTVIAARPALRRGQKQSSRGPFRGARLAI